MSLNRFKEALKPCSASSSAASATDPSSSSTFSVANPSSLTQSPPPARKPPKSSLSQQLQRLDLPDSAKRPPRRLADKIREQEEEQRERDERRPIPPAAPAVREPFSADPRGPFEPLLLSAPGETPVVQVPASINCRLLEHQRHGVRFMYSLYKNDHGGVLGDDMGLGKTIQTIAFLAAVIGKDTDHEEYQMDEDRLEKKGPVLIVCPTSVIHNWENEFVEWANFNVAVYHGTNRDLILERLVARGVDILITSFDTFRIYDETLSDIQWEIVIVDEAHRLKNEKSKLYSSFLRIKTKKRFGLTGTIMQNKISELFNLFDWVAPGSLGTREHFREFYDEPLKHGQRLNAPERFIRVADQRKQHLVTVLQKYLLRRTKEETIGHLMLGKEDNIVLCAMSDLQKRVYKRMLEQPDFQCLLNKDLPCSCGSPLTQVECCNRIVPNGIIWSYLHRDNPDGCDSCPFCLVLPCLVKLQQISNHLELIKPNPKDDKEKQKKDAELVSAVFGSDVDLVGGSAQNESFMGLSDAEYCGKMRALEKLFLSWTSNGDKILLFSYSVRMLNILEKFLIRKRYCFSRLDGSTPMNLRQSLVDEFNRSPSQQVFLISTRAGGLGLNLVSANRVVIFDPNWNPAQDLQAQDRSFRYGQKRHVIVFRLLAAGSLEELVYSRQVYKQQLSNIAVSGKMERRYFHGVQDCKEFKGELFGISNLFRDLSDKLFTNEIFESHMNRGQEYNHVHVRGSVGENGMDPATQTKLASDVAQANVVSCSRKSNIVSAKETESHLGDLGIVYAHRNEDVLNMGSGLQREEEASGHEIDSTKKNIYKADKGPKINDLFKAAGKPPSKKQKREAFRRLAEYMGVGELELSEWIISVSPSQRNEMLENYKKKKEEVC